MNRNGKPRVFIGPVEIAGHYAQLGRALRDIGVDAVSVDLSDHPFRYPPAGRRSAVIRIAETAAIRFERSRGQFIGFRLVYKVLEIIARMALLAWSVFRFDVFVFGFGETILYHRDLPLLSLLGKRLIFVFNGSDARPSYIDGADMAASLGRSVDDCIRLAASKKRRIRRIERHAHVIVSQPAFSHFFERPVVDFFLLGVPWTDRPITRQDAPRPQIIALHSPSNAEVKGTAEIKAAVRRVRDTGVPVELVELTGVPNSVVRDAIGHADFVIDQLFSDAPMVSFATEAASVGVPSIVGGYAWPVLGSRYGADTMPPVEACSPENLDAAITRLATDGRHRRTLGREASNFVRSQWAPERTAERYLQLMIGAPGSELMFDPRTLRYTAGVGMPKHRVRALVKSVIGRGGLAALQLGDKPELEEAFARFAAE